MKVMIVVTHLLGTGHLSRALTLAAAFRDAAHRVTLVSGGMPVPHLGTDGITFEQLTPVKSDGTAFRQLLTEADEIAGDALLTARRTRLVDIFHSEQPDAVITELFPFGRRILRDEFIALLDAIAQQPRPVVVAASIRDILAPPTKPAKAAFAEDLVARHYDAVLVHSDPAVTPLDRSWPVSATLAAKLRYTGFVAPPAAAPHPDAQGAGEIIVTAGGGDVGAALFSTAMEAVARDPDHSWRILVGGRDASEIASTLTLKALPNLTAEPARPDFRQMLHHVRASVSMCGYNTALDILQTRCPAVFVPFDAGNEVEQGIRAKALSEQPGIEMLTSGDLTPQTLLGAISRACATPRTAPNSDLAEGARRTVDEVMRLCEEKNGD